MLNRSQLFDDSFYYTLFNPSIGDFIINTYLDDIELILSILKSLGSKSSIQFIDNLFTNKKITKGYKQEIQLELFKYFYETKVEEKDFDFLILVSNLSKDNPKTRTYILNLIKELVESEIVNGSRLFELLSILIEFHEEVELTKLNFLLDFVESRGLDDEDISKLFEFIKLYKIEDESLISVVNEAIKTFLIDTLNEEKNNIDIGQYIENNYGQEYLDFDIDYSRVKQELRSHYEAIVSDFDNEVFEIFGIEESEIIMNIDIDKMGEDYFENNFESDEDYRGNISSHVDQERDIDEIFERS